MPGFETSMGGPHRAFPTTVWTQILAAGHKGGDASRQGLAYLVRLYWKPVFAYIRAAWKKSVEDSKDLTQAFFAHLLERDRLAALDPTRGSFRGFLKRSIRNFAVDQQRSENARRPSGDLYSLDALPGELERLGPAAEEDTPDRVYDREWFRCLYLTAIADMKERLAREGKTVYYDVFHAYCIEPLGSNVSTLEAGSGPAAPTYGEVASRFGLKETDVTNYLNYTRGLARRLIRERIREYVASDEEVDQELKEVVGG